MDGEPIQAFAERYTFLPNLRKQGNNCDFQSMDMVNLTICVFSERNRCSFHRCGSGSCITTTSIAHFSYGNSIYKGLKIDHIRLFHSPPNSTSGPTDFQVFTKLQSGRRIFASKTYIEFFKIYFQESEFINYLVKRKLLYSDKYKHRKTKYAQININPIEIVF